MNYSKETQLIGLEHINKLHADFNYSIGRSLGMAHNEAVQLQVPKNFTGDKYATQSLNVNGAKTFKFDLFANGQKQFPQDEYMQLAFLRVYTGTAANVEDTVWTPGVVDPQLINADIDVVNNGLTIYKNIPLSDFTRAEEQPYSGEKAFTSPNNWLAQTDLSIVLNIPKNVVVANMNLRFQWSGVGYIS